MSDSAEDKIMMAATAVMKALEPLPVQERIRVLNAAAALYGIDLSSHLNRSAESETFGGEGGGHGHNSGDTATKGMRPSIVEFVRQKNPATNSQRIAAFAFYREHVEGKATFVRGDLEHYFAAAKLAKPGNYDRDFTGAIREGWIHEDGIDSYLTQGGERAVREGFGGKAKPRGAAVARQK